MNETILVVDDEPKLVRLVKSYLENSGFIVGTAHTGIEATNQARRLKPALVVLDVMLPEIDGIEVLRRLRKESDVPVILLTARGDETDRVAGLETGADDYVIKPFSPKELVARVRAVLRRGEPRSNPEERRPAVRVGALVLEPDRRRASLGGRPLDLTSFQFDLLYHLAASPGRVYSRAQLVAAVQGEVFEGYERTIDAHIKNLRRVLGDDARSPQVIRTIRGVGYALCDSPGGPTDAS